MISIFSRYRSPEQLLEHTLIEMGVALEAGHIFERMPMLRDLAERFVWHFGDEVRLPVVGNKGPRLVDVSLAKALDWTVRCPIEGPVTLRGVQTLFAAGLLFSVAEVPFLEILVDGEPWSYLEGNNLGEELAAGAKIETVRGVQEPEHDFNNSSVRLLMLARLYPDGGHLMLDVELNDVLWPPWDMELDDDDEDED